MKNQLELKIQFYWTRKLSSDRKKSLIDELLPFSKKNVSKITRGYLIKRIEKYEALIVARNDKKLVGYMFAHIYEAKFPFVKIPTAHIGLTVVDRKHRGQNMAGKFAYQVYLATREKLGKSFFFSGVLLTSKCSSPISFMRMQKASLNFGLPRVKNDQSLDFISKSIPSKYLSKIMTNTVADSPTGDYLLKNVNENSGFQLEKEHYVPRNTKEEKIINYFNKHVMPNNELLYVSWVHPSFLLWW